MDEPGLLTGQPATCRLLAHAHVCSDVPFLHLKCFLVQFPHENNTIMKKINFVHLPVCARAKRGNRHPHLPSGHWPSRLNDFNVHV